MDDIIMKKYALKIKNIILDIINASVCPFSPEDNPFPQLCDRRKMFTNECKQCLWRK